jgi:hypothetical protein
MKKSNLLGMTALAAVLTACGGGDVNIDARNQSTVDNSVGGDDNGGGDNPTNPTDPENNPCASYTEGGETIQGSYAAPDCNYSRTFVSLDNPYTGEEELVFEALADGGVHIFADSLVIGQNYSNDDGLANAGITQGGDGSVLRLKAGVTLAFNSNDDYFVVNRGSLIFAEGEVDAPVTITSVTDAVDGSVGPEDVQQWGGMIINGFGVTNKCQYTGTVDENNLATSDCHVVAEGKAGSGTTNYGGDNNADSSGSLRYFVVKHTGAQVSPDNDLNGISFNAVGSGTEVDYLQVYSTYDDGIEFFGGAVDVSHFVAMYVRDDSIDIDEGYRGTIDYALVIQAEEDGANCMESDGIGSYSSLDQATIDNVVNAGLNSRPTIRNLTCIISPQAVGTHDPGVGLRIREAHFPTIQNAIVTTAYQADGVDETNYCLRLESNEGLQAAQDDELVIEESIFACHELTNGGQLPNGTSTQAWLEANNDVMETAAEGQNPSTSDTLRILNGFYSLPLGDMVVNGNAAGVTPVEGRNFVGAVTADDDWTTGWTYGLHEGNRGQPLWFEAE